MKRDVWALELAKRWKNGGKKLAEKEQRSVKYQDIVFMYQVLETVHFAYLPTVVSPFMELFQ